MNCLGVTGSGRAADLLTRQPGTDCSAEPQALTSTCSRQPPPCLRESSLVSAAACGPGCSQGQRGLVTCRWPFTLQRLDLPVVGNSATHTSQGKDSALEYMCMRAPTHAPTSTRHGHPPAYMLTFRHVLISTHRQMTGAVCAQNTEAQAHRGTNADRPRHTCMHALRVAPEQTCKHVYLEYM